MERDPDGHISSLSFLICKGHLYTRLFSNTLVVCLFVVFCSRFLLFLLQYVDLGHISKKKRAKRLGNVISNERDFSVSLETKKLFFRLLKRQNDWKENLKVATLS